MFDELRSDSISQLNDSWSTPLSTPPSTSLDHGSDLSLEESDALDSKSSGNSTILVGIKVLLAVARMPGPASLSEIKAAAGMSPSRCYRYLVSLTETGLLHQDPETTKYDLGPTAIEVGLAAMGRIDAIRLASDVMQALTNKVGMVSIISVWGSNGATVIRWEHGRLDLALRIREGLNLSLISTATGRIFLSYMDRDEIEPILEKDLKAWNAGAAPSERMDRKKLGVLAQNIRTTGLSVTLGLRTRGTGAIAAPVFDHTGRLRMSLAVLGLIGGFDPDPNSEPARELKAAAGRLSRMLGFEPKQNA